METIRTTISHIPPKLRGVVSKYLPYDKPTPILAFTAPRYIYELTITFSESFSSRYAGQIGRIKFFQQIAGEWVLYDVDDIVIAVYDAGVTIPKSFTYTQIPVYEKMVITVEFGDDVRDVGDVSIYWMEDIVISGSKEKFPHGVGRIGTYLGYAPSFTLIDRAIKGVE